MLKVCHFTDNANLLHFNSSIKILNRLISLDMERF